MWGVWNSVELRLELVGSGPSNKHVQSDTAPRSGIGAKIGYVTHFELRRASGKSRRG